MSDELEALLGSADPGPNVTAPAKARLENITVTKADGRVIDLGRPGAILYRYRLWRYKKGLI